MSRTPLREALHRLQSEGLITLSAHRGAAVSEFSEEALREIYTIRIALESYASFLATQLISEEEIAVLDNLLDTMDSYLEQQDWVRLLDLNRKFHLGVYAAARQRRLYDIICNYIDLADVYRRIFVSLRPAEMVNHRQLIDLLRKRDAVAVEAVTRKHLQDSVVLLSNYLKRQPDQTDAASQADCSSTDASSGAVNLRLDDRVSESGRRATTVNT